MNGNAVFVFLHLAIPKWTRIRKDSCEKSKSGSTTDTLLNKENISLFFLSVFKMNVKVSIQLWVLFSNHSVNPH